MEAAALRSKVDAMPKYAPIEEDELKHLHDVEIKTTTGAITCNSFLLSSKSEVFTAMFASGMKETTSRTVTIIDFSHSSIRNMIHYLHGKDLAEKDYDGEIHKVADKYNIPRLKMECELHFAEALDLSNVLEYWILSHQCQADDLKNHVITFLKKNWSRKDDIKDLKIKMMENPELLGDVFHFI